ncbi:hypothetical protein [Vibrio cholerae]|uniref:hypothetical protein n=1 Tax=Vibrio cholerae TaxID=666 RepID=UPI0030188701
MAKRNVYSLDSPHTCFQCCGSAYLRILEEAADSLTPEECISVIVHRLAILGEKRREYAIKKLAEQFRRLADFPPASGDPNLQREKTGTSPDFSPHPTHREWSVSSGAVAPSEGTPCASAHAEFQGSRTQENQG